MNDITALRLQLLSNGWSPIRNRDKHTYMKGWPDAVSVTPEEIARWERRFPQDTGTGLLVVNGLAVIDMDIDDEIIRKITNAILDAVPELADERNPLPIRFGKGLKEAWFCRTSEPFGRLHSRAWVQPGDSADAGTHRVEIFGGASSRQFGAFGPHTVTRDGAVTVRYRWLDRSPADTVQSELPVLTKDQFALIVDLTERILEEAGWTPVERTVKGEDVATRVFDLTEDMRFDLDNGYNVSLSELRDLADPHGGLRCSASWLEDGAVNTSRCLVSLTCSGHVSIWETASGVTHIEKAAEPATYRLDPLAQLATLSGPTMFDPSTGSGQAPQGAPPASGTGAPVGGQGAAPPRSPAGRPVAVAPTDRAHEAAAKLLRLYAFCPAARQAPVVPIWTDNMEAGLSMTNFRLAHAKNADELVGPRGGRQIVNPVDLWLGDASLEVIEGMQLRPDMPRPMFTESGKRWINVYEPPAHDAVGGDAQPGIDFLKQLVPHEGERKWVTQVLAHKVRFPHIPGPAIVMVAHGKYGTGRGVFAKLCGRLLGERYVKDIPYSMVAGRTYQSQYTDWAADALMVFVNESSETDGHTSTYQTKRNTYEHLKELVDPRPGLRTYITRGRPPFQAMSCASFSINTNHQDALPIPENDRRFGVVLNGDPQPPSYWAMLMDWMLDDANVAAFHRWLLAVDLSDYSPFEAPPLFAGKMTMAEASRSDVDRAFWEAVDAMPSQVMTISQITSAMARAFDEMDDLEAPDNWRRVVGKLASLNLYRVGVPNATNWQIKVEGRKYGVYAKSSLVAGQLKLSERLREEVLKNGTVLRAGRNGLFGR